MATAEEPATGPTCECCAGAGWKYVTEKMNLTRFLDDEPNALVFTTESGRAIWRGNFNKLTNWRTTVARVGVPGLHFHDLRHTGNTFAARTRREPSRSHGSHGARQSRRCADLPARHPPG